MIEFKNKTIQKVHSEVSKLVGKDVELRETMLLHKVESVSELRESKINFTDFLQTSHLTDSTLHYGTVSKRMYGFDVNLALTDNKGRKATHTQSISVPWHLKDEKCTVESNFERSLI